MIEIMHCRKKYHSSVRTTRPDREFRIEKFDQIYINITFVPFITNYVCIIVQKCIIKIYTIEASEITHLALNCAKGRNIL